MSGKCPTCDVRHDSARPTGTTYERGYDKRWQRLSERYRSAYPLCQVCESEGRITPATQVHHIEKVDNRETRLEWRNLLAVCLTCHRKIENAPQKAREIKEKTSAGSEGAQRW